MIETYKIITGVYDHDRDVTTGLFNVRKDSNTRGQRHKIFKEQPLEVRKPTVIAIIFLMTHPWNRLPDQVVEEPTIQAFKGRLKRHWRGHP